MENQKLGFADQLKKLMASKDPDALYRFLCSPKFHTFCLLKAETGSYQERAYYYRLVEKIVIPALERYQNQKSASGKSLDIKLEDKTDILKTIKQNGKATAISQNKLKG